MAMDLFTHFVSLKLETVVKCLCHPKWFREDSSYASRACTGREGKLYQKKKNKKQNKQKKTTTNPRKTQIWQNIKGLTKPTRVGGIRIIDFGFCAAIGPLKWNMLRLKAFELSSPSLGLKAFEPLTMSMRSFTSSLQKARDVWNFPDVFSSWRVSCCSFSGKQMKCVLLHPITELLAHVAFLG